MTAAPQRFSLLAHGRRYDLDVQGRGRTHLVLRLDGEVVADRRTVDERLTLTGPDGLRVDVRLTRLGRVRRATVKGPGRELDLDPEPGSPAARRLERERARPALYGTIDVLVAAAGVLLPLLGIGALVRLLVDPMIDRVVDAVTPPVAWLWETVVAPPLEWVRSHLPTVPLPTIDLPDLPTIDLSWIPDWTPPPWLAWVLEHADKAWPVLLAAVLARHEVVRRRRQDAVKERLAEQERQAMLARFAADLRAVADRR